jgi:hypothetical protein
VYESVQKFGGLITSGKITNGTDVSKIAELLLESSAFYDAEFIILFNLTMRCIDFVFSISSIFTFQSRIQGILLSIAGFVIDCV